MIPKVIHYIWLGGNPLPPMVLKCMESWKKFCPDWEIKCWDESNLDIDINQYCREAYDAKKYAFASDVLRFKVVNDNGGVYLDVDVELLKPLDDLLNQKAFVGFEMGTDLCVNPGLIIGSEKGGVIVSEMVARYKNDRFICKDGSYNYETVCEKLTSHLVEKYGLVVENEYQDLGEISVYPTEYFCPLNSNTKKCDYLTENTHSKHLYLASWVPKPTLISRFKNFCKKVVRKLLGQKRYNKLKAKIKGDNKCKKN